mmetsp:Transcript_42807/g.84108  ORF Transcript_42807/g.84108 Transcript_42807/m.84108 type:complete len:235 (-) Transcript_42807:211-915(-)
MRRSIRTTPSPAGSAPDLPATERRGSRRHRTPVCCTGATTTGTGGRAASRTRTRTPRRRRRHTRSSFCRRTGATSCTPPRSRGTRSGSRICPCAWTARSGTPSACRSRCFPRTGAGTARGRTYGGPCPSGGSRGGTRPGQRTGFRWWWRRSWRGPVACTLRRAPSRALGTGCFWASICRGRGWTLVPDFRSTLSTIPITSASPSKITCGAKILHMRSLSTTRTSPPPYLRRGWE